MIALLWFVLAILASPFKSRSLLEAENAALRRQLIVLRRKVHSPVRLTNNDRLYQSSNWVTDNCPVSTRDRHDVPGLVNQRVPGRAAVVDDIVEGFEAGV